MKKLLCILLSVGMIACIAAIPASAATAIKVGETRRLAFTAEQAENMQEPTWTNSNSVALRLEPGEENGQFYCLATGLEPTSEPITVRASYSKQIGSQDPTYGYSVTWTITVEAVPPTSLEQWQAKLPSWLGGIKSLPEWLQAVIRLLFFGWIWDIFPQN